MKKLIYSAIRIDNNKQLESQVLQKQINQEVPIFINNGVLIFEKVVTGKEEQHGRTNQLLEDIKAF